MASKRCKALCTGRLKFHTHCTASLRPYNQRTDRVSVEDLPIQKLVDHINRKCWWHVQPLDPNAYRKRGKFLASSFAQAEFYGRPSDIPERVKISRPLVGDNDSIERRLLGRVESSPEMPVRKRLALDAKLRRAALQKGYDSIVLMTGSGYQKFRNKGKMPRSIELNILDLMCLRVE